VENISVCGLYCTRKIVMSKVSKAAQKTTQLKYKKNACKVVIGINT